MAATEIATSPDDRNDLTRAVNVAVLAFSGLSRTAFLDWGWRIPFFVSIILVGVGLWIRLGVAETPIHDEYQGVGPLTAARA